MRLVDQMDRVIEVGDSVVPKSLDVQNYKVVAIESTGISIAPGQPPVVTLTMQCQVTIMIHDLGQPKQLVPLFLVKKAESALKPHLIV